jgi:hypothetical protein
VEKPNMQNMSHHRMKARGVLQRERKIGLFKSFLLFGGGGVGADSIVKIWTASFFSLTL